MRSVRAAVFAVLCVLLAAGGHALATGEAPPVWAQVAAVAPVFVAGCLLGGRERSLGGIGAVTLAVQAGLHVVFHAARPHHAGMVMHGMRMTTDAHAHALTPHATVAHLGAALVLTWWLRRGEAAVWSLLRGAIKFVPGLAAWWQVAGRGPDTSRPGPRAFAESRSLKGVRLRYAVHRRGPPAEMSYAI
ncbi:hypothetical protein [Streptomyces sp. NBC_00183]|uniref:hypothetical protein n=1 Tax=unclassified Streptomyces TaxID=2593676 RepID=UPI00224CF097|nr:hypothetical protein [Streptomyces sp. NBC_00183]MCX5291464.1 hypothetical protein [Streptomyces sp. NBC_00183]